MAVPFADIIPEAGKGLEPFIKSFGAMSEINLARKKNELNEQKTLSEIALNERMFPVKVAAAEALNLGRNATVLKTMTGLERQNQSDKVGTEFLNDVANATVVDDKNGDTWQLGDQLNSDDPTLRAKAYSELNRIAGKYKGRPGTPPSVAAEIQALRKIYNDKQAAILKEKDAAARNANTDADNKLAREKFDFQKQQAEENRRLREEREKRLVGTAENTQQGRVARAEFEKDKLEIAELQKQRAAMQLNFETSQKDDSLKGEAELQWQEIVKLNNRIDALINKGTAPGVKPPSKLDQILQRRKAAPATPQAQPGASVPAPDVLPPLPPLPAGVMLPGRNYPGLFGQPPQINLPLAARSRMA